MNALINAINEKTKIILENDGRLLKKSFFGLLLLSLVFQGGEFGEVIRSSMIDAYIQVSVFVGFTLFVFIGLDSLTKFDVKNFLSKTQKFHVVQLSIHFVWDGVVGIVVVHRVSKQLCP